jgi:uncharacterized protein YndB with AHSA1/START domain
MTVTESLPALEAVRRELEIDEQAPGGHPQVRAVLTLTTTLDLAPARLWPLLTRPAELAAWYGPVEGDLAEGGGCTAPDGVRGRVLEVEEPHRLTLVREQDGAESLFVLRLDPEDDGTTQLSLRHTVLVTRERFDAAPAPPAGAAPATPRRRRRPRGGGTARRGAATCGPGPCAGRPRRSPPGWTRSPHGAPRRRRCAPS